MHRLLYIHVLFLVAAVLFALPSCSHREPKARVLSETGLVPVPTAETSTPTPLLASGLLLPVRTLEAGRSVPVRAAAMGIVRQVYFEEGQRVRPGQILLKLDSDWHLPSRQLARGFIVAPAHGLLVGKEVVMGSRVQPGQLLATLQDWSSIRLTLNLPSRLAQRLHPRDTLVVHLKGWPQYPLAGEIEQLQVADQPDEPAQVILLARNPKHLLIGPAMQATAALPLPPALAE